MKRLRHHFVSKGLVIAGILLLFLLCCTPSSALSVQGAKYMGSIAPGGTDTQVITLSVGADEPATDVQAVVAGFGQAPDGGYTPLDAANDVSPYSARTFIALDNSTIHIQPGTSQSIRATITVPQGTSAGGRYAVIYLRTLPGPGVAFSTAVVVPVFITVTGTTPAETGSILQVDTGKVTVGQPITVTTSFKNTGNYHYYAAQDQVTVTDANGNVVANATTTPMVSAIIPGNTVNFIASPSASNLQAGTYTVDSKILLNGKVLDEKSTSLAIKSDYVPPATAANITVSPGSAATLTSPDSRFSVAFPQGAVLSNVVVTIQSVPLSQLNPAPSGAKLGATSFAVTGLAGLLSKPAAVTAAYSADDLAAAGGDASQLKLAFFDPAQSIWVILPTQVNTQAMTLAANTNQLGTWAVMVSSSTGSGTAAATTTKASLPPVLSISALMVAAVIMNGTVRRGR